MKFIALIPARANSIRIKNKNLIKFKGVSLVERTIITAKKSKYLKNIFLNSDSKKILSIRKKFKNINCYLRPKYLSTSKVKMIDVIKNFISKVELSKNDYVVLLQPTSPLRSYSDIDRCCKSILKNKSDIVVTVTKKNFNNENNKEMYIKNKDKKTLHNSNVNLNKGKNRVVYRNGPSVLVIKLKNLKNKLYFGKINYVIVPKNRSIDINNHNDLVRLKNYK